MRLENFGRLIPWANKRRNFFPRHTLPLAGRMPARAGGMPALVRCGAAPSSGVEDPGRPGPLTG